MQSCAETPPPDPTRKRRPRNCRIPGMSLRALRHRACVRPRSTPERFVGRVFGSTSRKGRKNFRFFGVVRKLEAVFPKERQIKLFLLECLCVCGCGDGYSCVCVCVCVCRACRAWRKISWRKNFLLARKYKMLSTADIFFFPTMTSRRFSRR